MTGLLLAAALAVAPPQEPPTFGVEVEVVYLDVFVSRRGEPVTGLRAENFVVTDDGVPQRVRLVNLEEVSVGAILVFDTSESVAGEGLRHLQDAGDAVLQGLGEGDAAALITFDHSPRLRVDLTSRVDEVARALRSVEAQGSTALYDGLYAGLTLPTGSVRPLVVLFTDGDDNASWLTPEQLLEHAARSDALVQVVGIVPPDSRDFDWNGARVLMDNPMIPMEELRTLRNNPRIHWLARIAAATGGRFWPAESPKRLEQTFLEILGEMGSRYLLAFEPSGPKRQGVHELTVRLEGARGDVRARSRYVAN